MIDEIEQRILASLPRELVVDLLDVAVSRAREAFDLVRKTDLGARSARALEGQARFRLMEKGFQDSCEQHGGVRLDGDVVPGTELRYYQPFMRFGSSEPGVLLGLASMPARSELPTKNRSRLAGVTLNYSLTPYLDLDGKGTSPQPSDVFALLLFARDPTRAGHIDEVALGAINGGYSGYLVYKSIESFLTGYNADATSATEEPTAQVTLKKVRKAFKAPEAPEADNSADAAE